MRRIVVGAVFIVLLVGTGPLCAGEVTGGGKIAAGAGWLSGSDWTNALSSFGADNAVRINFSVGPYFDFSLSDLFSVQAEVLYSSLGGAYTYYDAMVGDVEGRFYGGGIEILLFAKPKLHLNTGYLYVLAGPEVFFILGDLTQKEKASGLTVEVGIEPDNSVLLGASGGIGYGYPLSQGDVTAELRYTRSFTEVFEDDNTRFNGVTLFVGFIGPLGFR